MTSLQTTARKILVLRLSSLGDVILSTTFLRAFADEKNVTIDWVVRKEFAEVVEGHPRLRRVWKFDRSTGRVGWLKLSRELFEEGYDEVWDLHSTLRSRLLFWSFLKWRMIGFAPSSASPQPNQPKKTRFFRIRKKRWQLWGFFLAKRGWPKVWRPEHWRSRYAEMGQQAAQGELSTEARPWLAFSPGSDESARRFPVPYVAVMPSAAWRGKEWPTSRWVDFLTALDRPVVVLGTTRDRASQDLLVALADRNCAVYSGLVDLSPPSQASSVQLLSGDILSMEPTPVSTLKETAAIIRGAQHFYGVDTGLSHLAQALSVPATLFFGPTSPEQGFGPWDSGAHAVGSSLWCQPCGKDGRNCIRPVRKHLCMQGLASIQVLQQITNGESKPVLPVNGLAEDRTLQNAGFARESLRFRVYRWFVARPLGWLLKFKMGRAVRSPLMDSQWVESPVAESSLVHTGAAPMSGEDSSATPPTPPLFPSLARTSVSASSASDLSPIWFHAASVGEFETLWPVIVAAVREQIVSSFVVTVFSRSADQALRKLVQNLTADEQVNASGKPRLRWGASPVEGEWSAALDRYSPRLFITARYEAWPELWMAASARGIPISIVGARARGSLRIAASISRWLGMPLPSLRFFCFDEDSRASLKMQFGHFPKLLMADPRWDRVARRSTEGHPRARLLLDRTRNRSHVVWGSVWREDLAIWSGVLGSAQSLPSASGAKPLLWIVPHQPTPSHLHEVDTFLKKYRPDWRGIRSTQLNEASGEVAATLDYILVDEMGFLFELYSQSDWAYVGGGFSAGVHSTLEPGWYGLPIICGPHRSERFEEIAAMRRTGQLTLVADSAQLQAWMGQYEQKSTETHGAQLAEWRKQACQRLGGTQTLVAHLDQISRSVTFISKEESL